MYLTKIGYNVPRFGGGIGLPVARSSEGTAYPENTAISALYAYSVGFEDFVRSFGLQSGLWHQPCSKRIEGAHRCYEFY